jgi:hypothetical protein
MLLASIASATASPTSRGRDPERVVAVGDIGLEWRGARDLCGAVELAGEVIREPQRVKRDPDARLVGQRGRLVVDRGLGRQAAAGASVAATHHHRRECP